MNAGGDLECHSANHHACNWVDNKDACEDTIAYKAGKDSLVCEAMHKREWGEPGYDNPDHWCYLKITKFSGFSSY